MSHTKKLWQDHMLPADSGLAQNVKDYLNAPKYTETTLSPSSTHIMDSKTGIPILSDSFSAKYSPSALTATNKNQKGKTVSVDQLKDPSNCPECNEIQATVDKYMLCGPHKAEREHIVPCPEIDTCKMCEQFCNNALKKLDPKSEVVEQNRKRGPGGAPTRATTLPKDASERKKFPVASGVLDYFPDALVAISEISQKGNDQHNPGLPLRWTRSKSGDEADTCIRHFLQRGTLDTDGMRHTAKAAWRMLALLQKEIEQDESK